MLDFWRSVKASKHVGVGQDLTIFCEFSALGFVDRLPRDLIMVGSSTTLGPCEM